MVRNGLLAWHASLQTIILVLVCAFVSSSADELKRNDIPTRRLQGGQPQGDEAPDKDKRVPGDKRVNISEGDTENDVTRNMIIIAACLLVLVLASVAVLLVWRRQQKVSDKKEDDGPVEIKEWMYKKAGETKGPHTNTEMQHLIKTDQIQRSTEAKVVWWERDFCSISVLFPDQGSEFKVPAKVDGENAHSKWHRFSVHARPRGAGAELPIQMMWYYVTPAGEIQGPFETGKMRHWHAEGFFPEVTLMQMVLEDPGPQGLDRNTFRTLKELFPDLTTAFDTMPAAKTDAPPQMIGNQADENNNPAHSPMRGAAHSGNTGGTGGSHDSL